MMLEVAEEAAELRFGDDRFPFVYNTAKWDQQAPLAGWITDSETPRPSQLPWSLLGGWMMALQEPDRSMRNRLLRAVLWQTSRDSLRTGLQLAVDLSGAGFLLNRDDLTKVVALVLLARDQVDSDREMVAGLLGGTVPGSPQEFLNAPLTPGWVTRTEATSAAALTVIQQLIQMMTPVMATARSSSSLGEWVLSQQRLYNVAAPVLNGITAVLPKLPLALRAVMTQLREINADGGNYAELLKIKLYRLPSYQLVAEPALNVALQFQARLGADWADRLCRERVVVPDELRTLVLDITGEWPPTPLESQAVSEFIARQVTYQKPRCPQQWASFSPEYAHPFVHVLQPELHDPRFVSTSPLSLGYLGSHPLVQQVFTSNNVDAPDQRRSLLEEAARSRPGRFLGVRERLLIERVRAAAAGAIPVLTHTDITQKIPEPTWVPSPLIDELIQALTEASNATGMMMLQDVMSRAMSLTNEGRHMDAMLMIMEFQATYPWCADACTTVAVFNADAWSLLSGILEETPGSEEESALVAAFASRFTKPP